MRAIVRPHDIRIERVGDGGAACASAACTCTTTGRIQRLVSLGGHIKLDLALATGDVVTVHVSRREFESLGVAAGEAVMVDLESARLFGEDYVI